MTGAERQRRYRERRHVGEPVRTVVRPKDRRPRPKRWADAVDQLRTLQRLIGEALSGCTGTATAMRGGLAVVNLPGRRRAAGPGTARVSRPELLDLEQSARPAAPGQFFSLWWRSAKPRQRAAVS